MTGNDFDGAKIAIIVRGTVLALLRDDRPDLPWPGHWDLPGGGREGAEAPEACALRELREELGLVLDPARISHRRIYMAPRRTWFFGAHWPELDLAAISFGDEGLGWAAMPVADFIAHPQTIPHFRDRVAAFVAEAQDPAAVAPSSGSGDPAAASAKGAG